jgi:hypothetical protein
MIKKSGCFGCPIMDKPKDNDVCKRCGRRLGMRGDSDEVIRQKYEEWLNKEKPKTCEFPSCNTRIKNGKYCRRHSRIVSARTRYFKKIGMEKSEYIKLLHKPVKKAGWPNGKKDIDFTRNKKKKGDQK